MGKTAGKYRSRLRFLRHHWKELASNVAKTTVAGFGVIITFADALLNVVPEDTLLYRFMYAVVHLPFDKPASILLLIFTLVVIALIANWPKTRAVYKSPFNDLKVIIECCDLFEQSGLKVIHSVDTFDTALTRIINPNSVHGMFLTLCSKQNVDIDAELNLTLDNLQPTETDESLPGKKKRYRLGTICPVEVAGQQYAVVAFTHLIKLRTIAIKRDEYIDFLLNMWRELAAPAVRQEVINVTVMGNKFVDLPADFSIEQKIDLMIQTFFIASREKTCCKTLRICVHDNDISSVDFPHYHTIIDHLARRPIL